jgi:hypothetical protein
MPTRLALTTASFALLICSVATARTVIGISHGRAKVSCGPGDDTVDVSRFSGNRHWVTVRGDCEHVIRG